MYDIDYAYSEHTKEYSKMTAPGFLMRLFEHTAKDGTLIVPDHPYRMIDDELDTKWLKCSMSWTMEDIGEIRREFRKLWTDLVGVADEHPRLGKTLEENKEILSDSQLEVWNLFVRDLDDGRFERDIQRSIHKLAVECSRKERRLNPDGKRKLRKGTITENLDYRDEKVFVRWRHSPQIKNAIADRFGEGLFGFDLLIRMKRLYYLLVLEEIAPNDLYTRELKRIALYFVLNRFCSNANPFGISEGYALPLSKIKNIDFMRETLGDINMSEYYPIYKYDSSDPNYYRWEEVYYAEAKYGEDILVAFDDVCQQEMGVFHISEWISGNKELNPKGIEFMGIPTPFTGVPDAIMYDNASWSKNSKRDDITEEDVLDVLKKFAKFLEIVRPKIDRYRVPDINMG